VMSRKARQYDRCGDGFVGRNAPERPIPEFDAI